MIYRRELIGEALGTFPLVLMVFALTEGCNVGRPDDSLAPVFGRLTVTSIICLVAPDLKHASDPCDCRAGTTHDVR